MSVYEVRGYPRLPATFQMGFFCWEALEMILNGGFTKYLLSTPENKAKKLSPRQWQKQSLSSQSDTSSL